MSDDKLDEKSRREALQYEEWLAKVLKIRSPRDASKLKPQWLQILESSAVTTLLAVVVGGLMGNLLLAWYQNREKRSEQAIAEYKQYLEKEEQIVLRAYEVLGAGYLNAHRTIDLTRFWFQAENFEGEDQAAIKKQRTKVLDERNGYLARWEKEREQIGYLLSYYHYGRPEVAEAWKNARTALGGLIACSNAAYIAYLEGESRSEAGEAEVCPTEDSAYSESLAKLGDEITAGREYAWDQLGIERRVTRRKNGEAYRAGTS